MWISQLQNVKPLLEVIIWISNAIPTGRLIGTFHEWIKRLQTCIETDGEYVESTLLQSEELSVKSTGDRAAKGDLNIL
jgi:hypothetical protein